MGTATYEGFLGDDWPQFRRTTLDPNLQNDPVDNRTLCWLVHQALGSHDQHFPVKARRCFHINTTSCKHGKKKNNNFKMVFSFAVFSVPIFNLCYFRVQCKRTYWPISLLSVFRCVLIKEACLLFTSRSLTRVAHVQYESLGEHLQIPLKAAVQFGGIKGCGQKPPCLGVYCKVKSKAEWGKQQNKKITQNGLKHPSCCNKCSVQAGDVDSVSRLRSSVGLSWFYLIRHVENNQM